MLELLGAVGSPTDIVPCILPSRGVPMKLLVTSFLLLFVPCAFAEDPQLRQEAIRLMEKATSMSTAPNLPNLERIDTLRVFGSEPGVQEGSFTRVVIQGTGRRDETTFGNYHVIDVWTRGRLATSRTREVAPPDVATLMRLTPIYLVHFDHEDVIHAISDRDINGRSARCILFDTVAGQKTQNNELCVDAANGTLLFSKLGNETIENSDYFPFAGALMPGKIGYSYGGVRKLEISQTMTPLPEGAANVLAAPPDAQIRTLCTTFRRAFGESMPQPKAGNGGGNFDLVLRGMIGVDGKVHDAVIQSSERSDLDPEALGLIQQWVFTPAMCNGHPNPTQASFTLHFQGR
jgi:hypothetical protein